MVSFENFVKSMPPSLSELKVIPSFCFAFKIPDDVTSTNKYSSKAKASQKSTQASLLPPTGVGRDCHTLLDVYGSILCRSRIVVAFVEL